ncbi:hypothetical protein [Kutzneria sp. NPDC051319]|uniref:hypothetical protein n=1 Tax=Kutzneria sp. NPDC051319 TaxID=3155047 RepID=UPI003421086D
MNDHIGHVRGPVIANLQVNGLVQPHLALRLRSRQSSTNVAKRIDHRPYLGVANPTGHSLALQFRFRRCAFGLRAVDRLDQRLRIDTRDDRRLELPELRLSLCKPSLRPVVVDRPIARLRRDQRRHGPIHVRAVEQATEPLVHGLLDRILTEVDGRRMRRQNR